MHRVRTMKREAYLEFREEPLITIVVVVFGVVLIHSSSVGWTEVEIKKGRSPLERERERWNCVG